jgi:hypothetical protein
VGWGEAARRVVARKDRECRRAWEATMQARMVAVPQAEAALADQGV